MSRFQRISPFLWFDQEAEEAADFYVSLFPNSETVTRYTDAGPGPKGSVMTVAFQLDGQSFTALNGGPIFQFTEAISLVVRCGTQQEVDTFWERLSDGGQPGQCGWLKDKFGLSWQVVPNALIEMFGDTNPQRVQRVMKRMMQMKKLNIAELEQAHGQ